MVKAANSRNNNPKLLFVFIAEDLSELLNEEFLNNIGKFQRAFDKTGQPSAARSIINVVILNLSFRVVPVLNTSISLNQVIAMGPQAERTCF